jgi:hypothetical protein
MTLALFQDLCHSLRLCPEAQAAAQRAAKVCILSVLAALVGCGCGCESACAGSLPPDPQPRTFGSYPLPCGITVEVAEGSPSWTGTQAWGEEVCSVASLVARASNREIPLERIRLRTESTVNWNGRNVSGITVPREDGSYLVRVSGLSGLPYSCASSTALGHELLHVALDGDGQHQSELWKTILEASTDCRACARTASATATSP